MNGILKNVYVGGVKSQTNESTPMLDAIKKKRRVK